MLEADSATTSTVDTTREHINSTNLSLYSAGGTTEKFAPLPKMTLLATCSVFFRSWKGISVNDTNKYQLIRFTTVSNGLYPPQLLVNGLTSDLAEISQASSAPALSLFVNTSTPTSLPVLCSVYSYARSQRRQSHITKRASRHLPVVLRSNTSDMRANYAMPLVRVNARCHCAVSAPSTLCMPTSNE